MSEDRRQKTEDRGRRAEGGGRKTEDGGRKTEGGRRRAEGGGRRTAERSETGEHSNSTNEPKGGGRRAEVRGQRSEKEVRELRRLTTDLELLIIESIPTLQIAEMGARLNSAKDLEVYGKSYELAMRVFFLSCRFPAEERFALTSQIRRSSRSVCLNLREAWAKRRYEAHFISKLTDCDGENSETDSSLDFAKDCGFITTGQHEELSVLCREIGKMLGAMLKNPQPFLIHIG